jgi:hypothetical protein
MEAEERPNTDDNMRRTCPDFASFEDGEGAISLERQRLLES